MRCRMGIPAVPTGDAGHRGLRCRNAISCVLKRAITQRYPYHAGRESTQRGRLVRNSRRPRRSRIDANRLPARARPVVSENQLGPMSRFDFEQGREACALPGYQGTKMRELTASLKARGLLGLNRCPFRRRAVRLRAALIRGAELANRN